MIRRLLFLSLIFLAACEEVIEPTAPPLPVAAVSASANADRAALVALYEATSGPNWTHNENWLTDAPLGDWYGVEVDGEGRVVGLDLGAVWDNERWQWIPHGLSGPISPELGNLSELQYLDLKHNDLSGPIPPELGKLSKLQELDLKNSGLSGPIPSELGKLSNLRELDLEYNDLSGPIPPELGKLSVLRFLSLAGNDLPGPIPPELGNLSELGYLNLSENYVLSGPLPPELGKLSRLGALYLGSNNLTGPIPPEFGNLSRLGYLRLSRNNLSGPIPPELGKLFELRWLYLESNNLSGSIPYELGNLSELSNLSLSRNILSGPIPPEFGKLSALRRLYLNGNNLWGPIPSELGNLSALQWLYLNENNLRGSIPPEIGGLVELQRLVLSDNGLSGPISPELGTLSALEELDLNFNFLTGAIPPELGNLTNLESLVFSDNEGLAGPLPPQIATLPLTRLAAINTGLCDPATPAFQQLRVTIAYYRVQQCSTDIAYLVQAVQSLHYPVPLIAGRDALLRVFPTAPEGTSVPVPFVRGLFYDPSGELVWTVEIPGTPGPLPAELDEGNLALSANGKVPGAVLRPGVEMVVEIDPEGSLDPALGISQRVPAEGRTTLDIHDLPVMDMTMVPFLLREKPDSSVLAPVVEIAADPERHELLAKMRAVFPVHKWNVTAHDPVWTDDPTGFNRLYELRAIRLMEGSRGYWMGTIDTRRYGLLGVAFVPGYTSMSILDPVTMAHELGHNLSLSHAPCNVGGDPDFPYRRVLFSHSFAMPEVMDAGDEMGGFVYTLPVRPGWESLASITLSGPAGRARVDGSTARPMSIYRDRTGTVRAILRGDPMQADAMPGPLAGLALDVNTSRGIPAAAEWRR